MCPKSLQPSDSGLRVVKMDITLRVMLGRPLHVADILWSEGYEDEQLHRRLCQAKYKSQHTVDRLQFEDCKDIQQHRESCKMQRRFLESNGWQH